jgi:5-methylcytosine-specific restriction endonuclease McrA
MSQGEYIMLDHDKAMKLWEQIYGKKTQARDFRNRLIYKAAYGQKGSDFGWEVHHKRPKNQGGTDTFDNLQIVHVITHNEMHGR